MIQRRKWNNTFYDLKTILYFLKMQITCCYWAFICILNKMICKCKDNRYVNYDLGWTTKMHLCEFDNIYYILMINYPNSIFILILPNCLNNNLNNHAFYQFMFFERRVKALNWVILFKMGEKQYCDWYEWKVGKAEFSFWCIPGDNQMFNGPWQVLLKHLNLHLH